VGPCWPPHIEELRRLARRVGVDDLLEVTGGVDDAGWWTWLRRASVAVQLRRITNGETSAAVADAQAVGTPVVTNMVNARLDQPAQAVLAIDARLIPQELDDALVGLLTDAVMWRAHSEAARAHAAASSFGRVVDALLAHVDAFERTDARAGSPGYTVAPCASDLG
jgi:glycosyltransferase involved in cell wall biosynthesis